MSDISVGTENLQQHISIAVSRLLRLCSAAAKVPNARNDELSDQAAVFGLVAILMTVPPERRQKLFMMFLLAELLQMKAITKVPPNPDYDSLWTSVLAATRINL